MKIQSIAAFVIHICTKIDDECSNAPYFHCSFDACQILCRYNFHCFLLLYLEHLKHNDKYALTGTKKYFEQKCYKYICSEIQKIEGKHWGCSKFKRNLSGEQIRCDGCLDWFHIVCAGYTQSQGNPHFFCGFCIKESSLLEL